MSLGVYLCKHRIYQLSYPYLISSSSHPICAWPSFPICAWPSLIWECVDANKGPQTMKPQPKTLSIGHTPPVSAAVALFFGPSLLGGFNDIHLHRYLHWHLHWHMPVLLHRDVDVRVHKPRTPPKKPLANWSNRATGCKSSSQNETDTTTLSKAFSFWAIKACTYSQVLGMS